LIARRVVIPKAIRDGLGIDPGDDLELISSDEEIRLRPIREALS
jgi:AbrB family looped-hinge helix DNA binding protein